MSDKNKKFRMLNREKSYLRSTVSYYISRNSSTNIDNFTLLVNKDGNSYTERKRLSDMPLTSNIGNFERVNTEFTAPLKKINIQNIKSFEQLDLKPSNLNLFAGKNSSGKSTILETIALLTNWAHTKNTVYDGLAFKYDFGIKNFSEFKSNFAESDENIILEILSTNISDSGGFKIGNTKISFVLGGDAGNIDALKYAPIETIKFEYDNHKMFEAIKNNEDIEDSFVPVNSVIENHNSSYCFEDLDVPLNKGFDLMNFHSKKLEKLNLKSHGPSNFDKNINFPLHRDRSEQLEKFIKLGGNKKDKVIKKNTPVSYVDVSVCETESALRRTRLYGCSFASGEKEFKSFPNSDIDLFLGVNQNYLIRWLALDYINLKTEEIKIRKQNSTSSLDRVTSHQKLINNILENDDEFNQIVIDEQKKNSKTPPIESKEMLADTIISSLFNLNLKVKPSFNVEGYEFLGLFDFPIEAFQMTQISDHYKEVNMTNLLDWIKIGSGSLKNIKHNIKVRKKLMLEDTTFEKEEIELIHASYQNFTEVSLNLLELTEQAIVKISNVDGDILSAIKEMYKEIDDVLSSSKEPISFYDEWEVTKFWILEILSTYSLENSLPVNSNNSVLIPFSYDLISESFFKSRMSNSTLFSNINSTLKNSFESLFTTTFIGPLRERSEFKDDIFSYNYPYTLGNKGEKSGSFLSTFSENIINFPVPKLIKDIENNKIDSFKKYNKPGTYIEHLSNWINFLELADEIKVDDTGAIKVLQDSSRGKNLSLENIGVGVSQVLPVLLSCMTSQKADEQEILLLEQPELHLHPSAQAKLADFFIAVALSKKKSLFIETHSEHILNRLRLRQIQLKNQTDFIKIFFTNKHSDGKTKIEEFTINEDGSYDFEAYPEGFFDQTQLESREIAKALITKQTKKTKKNQ